MIEEAAGSGIQGDNSRHVARIQLNVHHIQVFLHPFGAGRLRKNDNVPLDEPADDDLSHALLVLLTDRNEQVILKDPVFPLGEWRPGFGLHLVLQEELVRLDLLLEGIDLNLFDSRSDGMVDHQVGNPIRVKVGNPDGLDLPLFVQLFHGPPLPIDVAIGLMDEVEVQIIQLKPVQRALERPQGTFVPILLDPELGGDEQLAPCKPLSLIPLPTDSSFWYEAAVSMCRYPAAMASMTHRAHSFGSAI